MDTINNIIAPIFQAIVYTFLIGCVLFIISKIIQRKIPKIIVYTKHKIFKKPFLEKDIEWTYDCIKRGYRRPKVIKELLKNGNTEQKIETIMLIYGDIEKTMKGGNKNGK